MLGSIQEKNKRFKRETLIVAVDVGKDRNVGYFRALAGEEGKPFGFSNTREGFDFLLSRTMNFWRGLSIDDVVVGLESTGVYGEPLIHYLKGREIKVVQVNPKHTKRLKELSGNSPNKTDEKDPKVIADVIELGHYLSVVVPSGVCADLRNLTEARERAMVRCNRLYNQLHALVFVIFPEFLQVMKGIKSKSALYLLGKMPLPEQVIDCGVASLGKELRIRSRGRFGVNRARELLTASRASVGVKEGCESVVYEIKQLLSLLDSTRCMISEIETRMRGLISQVPLSRFLLSLKGVGDITVAGLLGEFGGFQGFSTLGEVLKFAGMDLYEISSGKHQGQRRISKRGRALVRKLLYFSALNTVRKGGIMHEVYQRHLSKGMKKNKALVAVSRKLLGVMFALVRRQVTYDQGYQRLQYLKEAA